MCISNTNVTNCVIEEFRFQFYQRINLHIYLHLIVAVKTDRFKTDQKNPLERRLKKWKREKGKEINKPRQNCSMTWADERETRLTNTGDPRWAKNKRSTACCQIYTRASNFLIAFPSDIFMVDYSSHSYSRRASARNHPPLKPFHAATVPIYLRTYVRAPVRARFKRSVLKLNESGLLRENERKHAVNTIAMEFPRCG